MLILDKLQKLVLKPVFILSGTVAVAATVSVYTTYSDRHTLSKPEQYGAYISAFTSGEISKTASIYMVLNFDSKNPGTPGKPVENNLFDFSPSIRGSMVWKDKRTIEFRPQTWLDPDKHYHCSFRLGRLNDTLPKDMQRFNFAFKTYKQDFRVNTDGLEPYNSYYNVEWQRMTGDLGTVDVVDTHAVRKMLTARQGKKELPVRWVLSDINEPGKATHRFTVDSIKRGEEPGKLELLFDGKPIGCGRKIRSEHEVAAMGDFTITKTEVYNKSEQYVQLYFSDPLMPGQQLEGIVRVKGQDEPRTFIDGNMLTVYPVHALGNLTIEVGTGIKNQWGYHMLKSQQAEAVFEVPDPNIRMVTDRVILPNSGELYFPFEAVGLKAVDVTIYRLYENNVLQFLQINDITGQEQLYRVAKKILTKKVDLTFTSEKDLETWHRYAIDLGKIMKTDPGAIYRVQLSMKKSYSNCNCGEEATEEEEEGEEEEPDYSYNNEESDYDDNVRWDNDYESYEENPCDDYYYRSITRGRNLLASDLGVIAKMEPGKKMHVFVSSLVSTNPVKGATVEFYDFLKQTLGQAVTDENGMCDVQLTHKPFVIVVKSGRQRGYLKMEDGAALSLSNFDVAGREVQDGIKGFLYAERGVWRPGDSIYLSFIMRDELNRLPENHPVSMELYNPVGQVVKKIVSTRGLNGFYDFRTATDQEAPTGEWMARVKVGNREFDKTLKVETVKPNRLKLYMDFGKGVLSRNSKKDSAHLRVKWLHGADAGNLGVTVEASVSQDVTIFKNYPGYYFDDPVRSFSSERVVVLDDLLDDKGEAKFSTSLNIGDAAPGMLRASFFTRVFEESGNFSVDRFSTQYSPYRSYAGLSIPEGKLYGGMLETDKVHTMKLASVTENGEPVNNKLNVKIYRLNWYWWWDSYKDDLNYYISRSGATAICDTTLLAMKGAATYAFRIGARDWGRYLVRVTDMTSGHITGKVIYFDSPWWTRSNSSNSEFASMLSFASDKKEYMIGEKVKLSIPSAGPGKVLVSVESGTRVVKKFWADTKAGETRVEFTATADMAPNVFIHVSLLQPHGRVKNDLPIRLYGVIPISVEDPDTHLKPLISMADVLEPGKKVNIQVSESKGRAMTYTLAMVDEGLLDLTRFDTPEPWDEFYTHEALGIRTWDMHDRVIGAYGGKMKSILSIGGDGSLRDKRGAKANRFKPVVVNLGPFYLPAGGKASHSFTMPQYVGSVRVMVVAGNNRSYGNAEKAVPVRKPLMLLATLPRVVSPGEQIFLPVNVFAMDQKVKNVSVHVETNEGFKINGGADKKMVFARPGDEVVNFELSVAEKIGIGKVKIRAVSGKETAFEEIEIDVRPPNPVVADVQQISLEPGKEWKVPLDLDGINGSNNVTLEVSTFMVDLGRRLQYLISYPHGCIEQTTSGAFPQLALEHVTDLSNDQKKSVTQNIKAALNRIQLFQNNTGGFGYWPGAEETSQWGTNYAGHFMLEAEQLGYVLPLGLKNRWLVYQRKAARDWTEEGSQPESDQLIQAYRLYTLALAKNPELGAMNRLREYNKLNLASRWRLAAAYQLAGQGEVARQMVEKLSTEVKEYKELSGTFGSDERDEAMILETMTLMHETGKALNLAEKISKKLGSKEWMSTQTTAYCLLSVSKFLNSYTRADRMQFSWSLDKGTTSEKSTTAKVFRQKLITNAGRKQGAFSLKNEGSGTVYVRVIKEYIPVQGQETPAVSNVKLEVRYTDMQGKVINPSRLQQGSDFIAEVTVTNPGTMGYLEEMALNQIFPSGWEIRNTRMEDGSPLADVGQYTYQDIRDDRVYTYYNLQANTKVVYRVMLNATYLGRFYLPALETEAMYNHDIYGRVPGRWVEVVKSADQEAKK